MCLFITTPKGTYPKAKKAETDIVCYKIVKITKGPQGEEMIVSPFNKAVWNLGKVKKASRLIRSRPSLLYQQLDSTVYGVGAGYLHSYKDLETANRVLRTFAFVKIYVKQYKLYKAVIPEGTVYYEGDHGDGCINQYEGYASRKLKLIEEM